MIMIHHTGKIEAVEIPKDKVDKARSYLAFNEFGGGNFEMVDGKGVFRVNSKLGKLLKAICSDYTLKCNVSLVGKPMDEVMEILDTYTVRYAVEKINGIDTLSAIVTEDRSRSYEVLKYIEELETSEDCWYTAEIGYDEMLEFISNYRGCGISIKQGNNVKDSK